MDTPQQRRALAWAINLIGYVAITGAVRAFGLPWWLGAIGMILLAVALSFAGLQLVSLAPPRDRPSRE